MHDKMEFANTNNSNRTTPQPKVDNLIEHPKLQILTMRQINIKRYLYRIVGTQHIQQCIQMNSPDEQEPQTIKMPNDLAHKHENLLTSQSTKYIQAAALEFSSILKQCDARLVIFLQINTPELSTESGDNHQPSTMWIQ